jgi:tetratricopeptide (TPR) repeat protein
LLATALAALVLVLAFLASSFAARNADLWLHLAAGRLLAQGRYTFGTDPFAYTTAGVYWANHAWLTDLMAYLIYTYVGGWALVVLKALIVGVAALFMLLIRRPGKAGWAPAFCTALAVLAMSWQLLLQPTCISLALLALSLWLLARPVATGQRLDPCWFLPVVCALWVNLDAWFFLGPALAALFWLGDRVPAWLGAASLQRRPTPWLLAPVCIAACLMNPHHVFAFTLPAELSPAFLSGPLLQDARVSHDFTLPWAPVANLPVALVNPTIAAFYVLVFLGLASFVLNQGGFRDWRAPVWFAFAVVGAWHWRLTPFFAVVAAPIAALNFQDATFSLRRPALSVTGKTAAALGVLVLLALTVPGWLSGPLRPARPLAWTVEADPSLDRLAQSLHALRDDGRLREGDRVFAMHPAAASYLTWACPEEKSFLDLRFTLFADRAAEFVEVCRAFDPPPSPLAARAARPKNWSKTLEAFGVTHVLLYDPNLNPVLEGVGRVPGEQNLWGIEEVAGQAVVLRWRGGRPDAPTGRFDAARLAFGPADERLAPEAPSTGPRREPHATVLERFLQKPERPTWDSGAAAVYLKLFAEKARQELPQVQHQYFSAVGGGTVAATIHYPTGPLDFAVTVPQRLNHLDAVLEVYYEHPPELPLLAVRAARRAAAGDPDDANAYFQLAQAYLALRNDSVERTRGSRLSPVALLRHSQAAAALRRALVLNPDLATAAIADRQFADLLTEQGYVDAALEHRRSELAHTERAGPDDPKKPEPFQRRVQDLKALVDAMEQSVQANQNKFVIHSKSVKSDDVLEKAQLALRYGLASHALDEVLMKSRVEHFGSLGARQELELLIKLGRTNEARVMLDDAEMKKNKYKLESYALPYPGRDAFYEFPAYEWLLACAAAADGDYDLADAALRDAVDLIELDFRRSFLLTLATEIGVGTDPSSFVVRLFMGESRENVGRLLAPPSFLQSEASDLFTLRGVLALERGRPSEASTFFREALARGRPDESGAGGSPTRVLAAAYLKAIEAVHDAEK